MTHDDRRIEQSHHATNARAETMQRLTIATLAFALTCATITLAVPDRAQAQQLHLETSVTTEYAPDSSFDALSNNNAHGVAVLKAAYSLDRYIPVDGLRAYLELNTTGAGNSRFDNAWDFDWSRGMYLAGADWGPTFGGFIRPFIRVTAGYARQQLRLTPAGDSQTFSQRKHGFATKDSVGLELHFPYKSDAAADEPGLSDSFTLGMSGQFGLVWHTPAKFDDLRASYGADDPWTRSGVDVGQLKSTGTFWDIGLFARFKF